jgi:very-short-patch-repair endonuclease
MQYKSKNNQYRNNLLYNEVEKTLICHDPDTQKEVYLKKIMICSRKFRADFYCPNLKLIVEINGGEFKTYSRHTWGLGYQRDLEKINIIQINGFIALQYTYNQLAKQSIENDILKVKKLRQKN